jgi:hypothetical protein
VSGANRSAAQPRLDEVRVGASEGDLVEAPNYDIAGRADSQHPEAVFATKACGRTNRRDLQHVAGIHGGWSILHAGQQQGRPCLEPQ